MKHQLTTVHPYLIGYRDCAGNTTPIGAAESVTEDTLLPHPLYPEVWGKFICSPGECQYEH